MVVFAGPTLPPHSAPPGAGIRLLPPAAQGDIHRAARDGAQAIGLVDGAFESVPAVWHKEILWALSHGTPVFGSASLGALRAAELDTHGMTGVGEIYQAFRQGLLEDDDEVAVAHATSEFGFRPLSEAMVNIRWTIASAVRDAVIAPTTEERLIAVAKGLYYPERGYGTLLRLAAASDVRHHELLALQNWLPGHRINRKRLDAHAMLQTMTAWQVQDTPLPCAPRFEPTAAWLRAMGEADEANPPTPHGRCVTP
ncbi:TfuA-like protein [Streptomyces sp. NPDC088789]|uniref:TfuA-like protein n=1 Tax=Streptomyces sp. NPDC088789 TaxID=3365899 RepID=UPI003801ABBD